MHTGVSRFTAFGVATRSDAVSWFDTAVCRSVLLAQWKDTGLQPLYLDSWDETRADDGVRRAVKFYCYSHQYTNYKWTFMMGTMKTVEHVKI